ncbi:MAG: hypothetical protein JWP97_3401 [Labilithrix sp.]|nr:hypothetical protein [Labilithrix sp.]
MRLADHFARSRVRWFLRLFGLAVVVDVLTELSAGVWGVHTGALYPWRHLGIVPLYGPAALTVEWSLRSVCGLLLLAVPDRAKVLRVAVRVLALTLGAAVLERYSNHGVLLFLVALFVSIDPPDLGRPDLETIEQPALGLVRAQLLVVYAFSALNKLTHGFASGASLTNLLHLPERAARPLSWAVIAAEIAVPALLLVRSRPALLLVALLHASFTMLVPNVASFSLVMLAMALLFDRPTSVRARRADPRPG